MIRRHTSVDAGLSTGVDSAGARVKPSVLAEPTSVERFMASRRNHPIPLKSPVPPTRQRPGDLGRGMTAAEIDWDKWTRHIESRRRRLAKAHPFEGTLTSRAYLAEATYVSFRLDGLDVSETEVATAVATGVTRRIFRSRQAQRVRNHVALLREIDAQVLSGEALMPESVVRWYTSISCGLCPADPAEATQSRLIEQIHRINFPELRLSGAIQEIAKVHRGLLVDPLVPSFNGILSRLLLRHHLGRCGLPPIFFHPDTPTTALTHERILLPLLMELVENSYEVMLPSHAVKSHRE